MTARFAPIFLSALFLLAAPAAAQEPAAVVAVPPLTTPDTGSRGGDSPAAIAWQASQLIASDLRSTSELVPVGPNQKDYYSYPEVTAPTFSRWRSQGAKYVLTGFVRSNADGRFTVGCYVYDVAKGRELGRIGFAFRPEEWRRAAHKCSGLVYTAATGAPAGLFDTRIAYVAESGFGASRVKRIAVMDSDGTNHAFVTVGDSIVLTPRLAPKADGLAYVSFVGGQAHIRVIDFDTNQQRPLVATGGMTFAPRYSADGANIVFSMQQGPNTDIYVVASTGGVPRRLTAAPGVDTAPSFSPDASRIIFESDRSGAQQLYVMNADGTGQRRISFGGGWYADPVWSPDGEWIAFTRRIPGFGTRIGVMKPDGSGEQLLTAGPNDEAADWAPSSREIIFQRSGPDGRSSLYRVAIGGGEPRKVQTPQSGSDPDWSGVID
jgi:TolB protein